MADRESFRSHVLAKELDAIRLFLARLEAERRANRERMDEHRVEKQVAQSALPVDGHNSRPVLTEELPAGPNI
jgi:hypothetical protein